MASTVDFSAPVRHLHSSSRMARLKAAQALALAARNGLPAASEAIAAAGGVPPLLDLVSSKSGSDAVQHAVLTALDCVAGFSPAGHIAVRSAGGVPVLVRCLQPSSSQQVLSKACYACATLVFPGRLTRVQLFGVRTVCLCWCGC